MSGPGAAGQRVRVPAARLERWLDNFAQRHGATTLHVAAGGMTGLAADGSTVTARLPFEASYDGPADAAAFAAAARPPERWGVLLVRKGGFAVALLDRDEVVASKVGRRHVQGRSKAGGQSQQRFARRRGEQAREAYRAAADHAAAVLGSAGRVAPGLPVVTGGDRSALRTVLGDPRLAGVHVVPPWVPAPDPRRSALDAAVLSSCSVSVDVVNR